MLCILAGQNVVSTLLSFKLQTLHCMKKITVTIEEMQQVKYITDPIKPYCILLTVHICNIYGDRERHDSLCLNPDVRRFCIFSLAFSADGNEILGGANDGGLYIYDRFSNQRVLKVRL